MAISPIAIASHGTLNSPLSVAAVRGHLTIGTLSPPGPGGGLGGGRWVHPAMVMDKLWEQIEREEDEILTIIAAFLRIKR